MLKTINKLRIVSRKSRLALEQAKLVQIQLQALHPNLELEIIGISTSGDQIIDQPLNKIGGKGLFVKELEHYLLQGLADIAVHSMKDMPAELPPGLELGAILERADPRDVFVSVNYRDLASLPTGAVVGTSSLRRQAQILALRSDLKVLDLRGNVETRIQKLQRGEYAAIILAAAGLERLALLQWLGSPFSIEAMLPAVGQGALGIEFRSNDHVVKQLIAPLNHQVTADCVYAERGMNAKLNGGCQAPIAGFASISNNILTLRGIVAEPNGSLRYSAQLSGDPLQAVELGERLASDLIGQGATEIIARLKNLGQLLE